MVIPTGAINPVNLSRLGGLFIQNLHLNPLHALLHGGKLLRTQPELQAAGGVRCVLGPAHPHQQAHIGMLGQGPGLYQLREAAAVGPAQGRPGFKGPAQPRVIFFLHPGDAGTDVGFGEAALQKIRPVRKPSSRTP